MDSKTSDHNDQLNQMDVQLLDVQLWQAIAQGDTAALGTLYDRHAGLVYAIALKGLSDAQEAEDLTQDIFIKLPQSRYDPKRGSLRTYLAILTRSRAIDRVRSRQSARRSVERLQGMQPTASESPIPMQEVVRQEQRQDVRIALEQLSAKQQQILRMAYYDGRTQAQIAEELDTPLGTVKTNARRGLLKLRQILEQKLD